MLPPSPPGLEQMARPLLELIRRISGLESAFVTLIDWDGLEQHVIFSLNTGEMQVPEGSRVPWNESMCRSIFLSGRNCTTAVGDEVPATVGARQLGMRTFFAVPIAVGEATIGTVCGASQREIALDERTIGLMELVAQALACQLHAEQDHRLHAQRAQRDVEAAHGQIAALSENARTLEQLAYADPLTGLPNRRGFMRGWEDMLARSGHRGHPVVVLLIDADAFKQVNDRHGHPVGDAVLQAVATALRDVARSEDLPARLGGDEFALAATHLGAGEALALAERLRAAFAREVAPLGIASTLSVGIGSSDESPRAQLLSVADAALYCSKERGGDAAVLWRSLSPLTPE